MSGSYGYGQGADYDAGPGDFCGSVSCTVPRYIVTGLTITLDAYAEAGGEPVTESSVITFSTGDAGTVSAGGSPCTCPAG